MTLDFKKARQLCTPAELALVESTRPPSLRSLTARALRLKVRRARGLRDKFRDLEVRQSRAALTKEKATGRARPLQGPVRTRSKAELFDEVLRRFETRAAEVEASSAEAERPARRRARLSRSGPGDTRSERAAAVHTARKHATSPAPRQRAHVSSRNRRGQAARDSR